MAAMLEKFSLKKSGFESLSLLSQYPNPNIPCR